MLEIITGDRENMVEKLRETMFAGVLASTSEEKQKKLSRCIEIDSRLAPKGRLKRAPAGEEF